MILKTILVGYFAITSSLLWALVPVEGILLGEAVSEYQEDPLYFIFSDIYDKSNLQENIKVKVYQSMLETGLLLKESCELYSPPVYASTWAEKQAKRTIASSMQYMGLDASIKVIGAYAKKFDLNETAFKNLSQNLVTNYCSKNITVFSIKRIEEALNYYYKYPQDNLIPSVKESPFASTLYKSTTESNHSKSNEFDMAISNFKAFCSWGGDITDYRLMVPYLKNGFIMSFLIKNLTGVKDTYDHAEGRVVPKASKETIQVKCTDLICRKVDFEEFKKSMPLSVGTTGLHTDLTKLYCHHFKTLDYSLTQTIPQVRGWLKKMELEDPIFETNYFISLLSAIPDATLGVDAYGDLPAIAKSSIDERWNLWATDSLRRFSNEMLYEESLKIKVIPRSNPTELKTKGFQLDFSVTLGEMDRILDETDKISLSMHLKLSKNFLRFLRSRWSQHNAALDEEAKYNFLKEVAGQIEVQLKEKEKFFHQKMWNNEFSRLITQELIAQLQAYKGPLFDSYQEEMLVVPIKFSYGVFALSYLRYRSDVKAGRLRLNL